MKKDRVSFVLVLYVIAWLISPPLAYGTIYRIIAIVAILFLMTKNWNKGDRRITNGIIPISLLTLYMVIVGFLTGDAFTQRIHIYIFLFSGLAFGLWNTRRSVDKKELEGILAFTFILFSIWNITSYLGVVEDAHVMRELAKNGGRSEMLMNRGVGGYGYIYSLALTTPIGIQLLLNKSASRKLRFFALVFACTGGILIANAQYFMAMIIFLLSIMLIVVLGSDSNHKKAIAIMIVTLFLLVIANMERILLYLIENVDVGIMKRKLTDTYMMMLDEEDVGDTEFGQRYRRYIMSLEAIASSPIWGGFYYKVGGNHSYILDYFAQYGIPLGIVFLKHFIDPIKSFIKKNNPIVPVFLLSLLIIAGMNILPIATVVPIFVLLPVSIQYCEELSCQK